MNHISNYQIQKKGAKKWQRKKSVKKRLAVKRESVVREQRKQLQRKKPPGDDCRRGINQARKKVNSKKEESSGDKKGPGI